MFLQIILWMIKWIPTLIKKKTKHHPQNCCNLIQNKRTPTPNSSLKLTEIVYLKKSLFVSIVVNIDTLHFVLKVFDGTVLYVVICDHYDSLAVERTFLWLSRGDQGASPVEEDLALAHSCPSGKEHRT